MSRRLETASIAVRLRRELRRRRAYDRLDDAGQAAWRAARLGQLRRHALRSPGYQELHHGLTDAPLRALPIVTKDDVVDRFDELVTDRSLTLGDLRRRVELGERPARGLRVSSTSGSSGRPGLFPFTSGEWVQLLAASARSRVIAGGAPPTSRVRMARIGSPSPWHLSTQLATTLADPRRPTLHLSAAGDIAELCARLGEWQPDVLVSYPSVLASLAGEQLAGRLDIRPVRIFSGGERLAPGVRSQVAEAWDVRPFDQYVTAEAGFVAVECGEHEGMHVLDDHVVLEVVDAGGEPVPAGQPGERVLVTVLGSRALPLIRYELGDVATAEDRPCPCGRRSPRLRSVASTARSLLGLPAAGGGEVRLHPVAFTAVLDRAPVRAWQVVRHADRIEVLVVDPSPSVDPQRIASELRRALEAAGAAAVPVDVVTVDELRRAPSGKAGLVVDGARGV